MQEVAQASGLDNMCNAIADVFISVQSASHDLDNLIYQ